MILFTLPVNSFLLILLYRTHVTLFSETWNTANLLHILQTHVSKDSRNSNGVDETCVRLRCANRTYSLHKIFQFASDKPTSENTVDIPY